MIDYINHLLAAYGEIAYIAVIIPAFIVSFLALLLLDKKFNFFVLPVLPSAFISLMVIAIIMLSMPATSEAHFKLSDKERPAEFKINSFQESPYSPYLVNLQGEDGIKDIHLPAMSLLSKGKTIYLLKAQYEGNKADIWCYDPKCVEVIDYQFKESKYGQSDD